MDAIDELTRGDLGGGLVKFVEALGVTIWSMDGAPRSEMNCAVFMLAFDGHLAQLVDGETERVREAALGFRELLERGIDLAPDLMGKGRQD